MTPLWDERFETLLRQALDDPPVGTIHHDTDMRELGLDSTGLVMLLLNLEAEYELQFSAEEMDYENISTPTRLWELLLKMRTKSEFMPSSD